MKVVNYKYGSSQIVKALLNGTIIWQVTKEVITTRLELLRPSTATVTDFEGRVLDTVVDELRHQGLRRVENLVTTLSSIRGSSVPQVDGWTKFTADGSYDPYIRQTLTDGAMTNRTFVISADLKRDAGQSMDMAFVLYDSGFSHIVTTPFIVTATEGRYSGIITFPASVTASTVNLRIDLPNTATNTDTFYYKDVQIEEVTGQSNLNPSEYVSEHLVLSPELLPQGDFETTANFSSVSATGVITGGELVVTGTATTPSNQSIRLEDFILEANATYLFSMEISELRANPSAAGIIVSGGADIQANNDLHYWYPSSAGTHTTLIKTKTNTSRIRLHAGTRVGVITVFDNVTIKEVIETVYPFDVGYFNTTNGNTVTSNVVTHATGTPIVGAGKLLEGDATNKFKHSRDLATQWLNHGLTSTKDTLTLDTNSVSNKYILQNSVVTATKPYTITLDAVYESIQWVQFTGSSGFLVTDIVNVDVQNGTIGFNSGLQCSVTPNANGSVHIEVTMLCAATHTAGRIVIGLLDNNTSTRLPAYSSATADSIKITNLQMEEGKNATSHIPTTTGSATRAADEYHLYYQAVPQDFKISIEVTPHYNGSDVANPEVRFFASKDSRHNWNYSLFTDIGTTYGHKLYSGGLKFTVARADLIKDEKAIWTFQAKQNGADVDVLIKKDTVTKYTTTITGYTLNHSNQDKIQIGGFTPNDGHLNGVYGDILMEDVG